MERVTAFWLEECGAVTVDWVVLTAGIVGLAVAAAVLTENGTLSVAATIVARLTGIGI